MSQAPLTLPNLNADAKKVARDVLQGAKVAKDLDGANAPTLPTPKDTFIDSNERRSLSSSSSMTPPALDISGQVTPTPLDPYGSLKNEPHRLSVSQMDLDDNDRTPTDEWQQLTDGVSELREVNGTKKAVKSSEEELSPRSKPKA